MPRRAVLYSKGTGLCKHSLCGSAWSQGVRGWSHIFFFFFNELFHSPQHGCVVIEGRFESKFTYFTASCLDRSILLMFCWDLINSICSKECEWKRRSATASFVIVFLPVSRLLWLSSDAWLTKDTSLKFCGMLVEVLLLFSAQSDSSSFAEVISSISTWWIACAWRYLN